MEKQKTKNKYKTSNYDLNIWDELSYNTSGEETGGWIINIYKYAYRGAPYGSGTILGDRTITLTPAEAKRLTLGWGTELGGDYTPDDDFWIDKETFLQTYEDIPERVANLLWALPEYEQFINPSLDTHSER